MLKLVPWNESQPEEFGFWRQEVSVTNGNTSDFIILNYNSSRITCAVFPVTKARCEYSLSSVAELTAGTAQWIVWPYSDVTKDTADSVVGVVRAVRLVSVTGDASMEVLSI